MSSRRGFLGSILALGAAPAIIKTENLMKMWVPQRKVLTLADFHLHDSRVDEILSILTKQNDLLRDMHWVESVPANCKTTLMLDWPYFDFSKMA